jgi:hypothetical protein
MTDLEAVRLAAEAMGLEHRVPDGIYVEYRSEPHSRWRDYNPLHDKAQAFELVERFWLSVYRYQSNKWCTEHRGQYSDDPDLARAIVYCVANMQAARRKEGE